MSQTTSHNGASSDESLLLEDIFEVKKVRVASWTKYGEARMGIISEAIYKEWYCSSCAKKFPVQMSPMLYHIGMEEFIRVCDACYADGCKEYHKRIDNDYWNVLG